MSAGTEEAEVSESLGQLASQLNLTAKFQANERSHIKNHKVNSTQQRDTWGYVHKMYGGK